jgi:hypothetical protein
MCSAFPLLPPEARGPGKWCPFILKATDTPIKLQNYTPTPPPGLRGLLYSELYLYGSDTHANKNKIKTYIHLPIDEDELHADWRMDDFGLDSTLKGTEETCLA